MATESTIQSAVWQMELGRGRKVLRWLVIVLIAAALSLIYTASQFRGFEKRESMDMAQLARNLARGQGFTTYLIRPLGLWQLKIAAGDHDTATDESTRSLQSAVVPPGAGGTCSS